MERARKYSEDDFVFAVQNSQSWAGVLKKIGLKPAGGNYQLAKRRAESLSLNTSHFTGKGHLKGKTHDWAPKQPLDEILVKNSTYTNSDRLRQRLIKEGILDGKCDECGLSEWRGCRLSVELDHKNGDRRDNRIENLQILCPNCHSLTPTWRGRHKKQDK